MPRKKFKPPYPPHKAKMYIRKAGLFQRDIARALNITDGAVSRFIDGSAKSDRFWAYFETQVIPLAKAS